MTSPPAIVVENLSHRYGERQALSQVAFTVGPGEIFGLLGPNGGGKSTLFRIMATLLPVQEGVVQLLGSDVRGAAAAVRRKIGVTFQSPSLDRKLTVRENLTHQGHLYGLRGADLRRRIDERLARLRLSDRAGDRVESLSGGLARRVEIAKGLLHDPQILLLDEPSTGLDPGARRDLWDYFHLLRESAGVTLVVATHLMEEADRCDRLAILDAGRLAAAGTPTELTNSLGGDCLTIRCGDAPALSRALAEQFAVSPRLVAGQIRLETPHGREFLDAVIDAFGGQIESITLGRPTLEDVFVQRTGHRFWSDADDETASAAAARK